MQDNCMTEKDLYNLKVGDIIYSRTGRIIDDIGKVKSIDGLNNKDKYERSFTVIMIHDRHFLYRHKYMRDVIIKFLYSTDGNFIKNRIQYYRVVKTNKMLQRLLTAIFNSAFLVDLD
jgi:hypothetical protein